MGPRDGQGWEKAARLAPHDSAAAHVSGQSKFVDDRPRQPGELIVGIVYSKVASGELKSLDMRAAQAVPGVVATFTASDFTHNQWGTIFQDQPFLARDRVNFVGEPLALIAGVDRYCVAEACAAVQPEIVATEPIASIGQARAQAAFIGPARTIARGDAAAALAKAPHRLQGVCRMAGQDHFYLESQAAIAYPGEGDGVEIHASSQHPTEVQHLVAEALGLRQHQVVCVVKRMGGAFGGKESQAGPFSVYAAMVALRTGRPARVVITKDDDMIITGKRNPFEIEYDVGFNDHGEILGLQAKLFSDGGAYADLSTAIMERAMLHMDNAYYLPDVEVTGQVCRTNFHPSTAFRGFGGPKGVITIESVMEDIARHLKIDSFKVRRRNVYDSAPRNVTHYGQTIVDSPLPRLFDELAEKSAYDQWRADVRARNAEQEDFSYGLAMSAIKFGISFTTRFLNQGSALVNLHLDGTVQVSTGATEMGQGVNTKIAVVVAETFGLPVDAVRLMPTSTEKNHNTSATAASSGSDINGRAAVAAALKIRRRLEDLAVQVFERPAELRGRAIAGAGTAPELKVADDTPGDARVEFADGDVFLRAKPDQRISLPELLDEAYLNRISLGDHGFYRYPGIHFDKVKGQGSPFLYYTNGVAASEVKLDRLTGEVKLMRTDLIMDLGRPIHHGIDMGQVTGAFIQGVGWVTTEALYYDEQLLLRSHSPSTYKIPGVHDVPRDFNVELWAGGDCPENIRGSKAVGEPPLMLAASVWAAIKDGIAQVSPEGAAELSVPATNEVILRCLHGGSW